MAAPASSMKAVIAALGANSFITVIKFIAFAFSGSGAMLSEAIHSLADAGNQALLLVGLRRARRESDDEFHYGYGGERFIFGMLSASGIFFVGCGVTVYHGVDGLMHPHMPELRLLTWVVLGTSLVIEGGSTLYAFTSVMAHRPRDYPRVRYLREKVDPAALAILLEDSAAICGLVFAAAGIVLAYFTQNPMWDSIGSILVGVLLGYVAIHLVLENRGLLLGKAVPEGIGEKFEKIIRSFPSVRAVYDVKTRMLTPEVYKMKAELILDEKFFAGKLEASLPADQAGLSGEARAATLQRLAAAAIGAVSDEIDAIETAVRKEIPEAWHIDLEVDQTPDPEHARGSVGAKASAA